MLKDQVINEIIAREGGYSNNPNDAGGETMYGITKAVAVANGYKGAMKDLPRQKAYDIYVKQYWDALNLDQIEKISGKLAAEIADTGVNCGVQRAGMFLQRALNLFGEYAPLTVDGAVGGQTIASLNAFIFRRGISGVDVLLDALNVLQGYHYIEITEKNPKNRTFIYGWFKNRIGGL